MKQHDDGIVYQREYLISMDEIIFIISGQCNRKKYGEETILYNSVIMCLMSQLPMVTLIPNIGIHQSKRNAENPHR